jgi:phosphoesterase RecJ-like protein
LVTVPPSNGNKQSFQATVVLDTSTRNRLGTVFDAIDSPGVLINIDHHISNHRYGDINFIDPSAPATGQILFDLLQYAKANLTPDIAINIFAAISTDTGSFQYRGTSPHTFEIAASLLRLGVDVAELSQAIYDNQSRRRFQLVRHALNHVEFFCGDAIAHFSLLTADLEQLHALPEDSEGIIDHMRSIEGVLVAIFFEELPNGEVRISTRSKDPRIDVCKICGQFGGGGHPAAAGVRTQGPLSIVRQQFLDTVCHEIKALN